MMDLSLNWGPLKVHAIFCQKLEETDSPRMQGSPLHGAWHLWRTSASLEDLLTFLDNWATRKYISVRKKERKKENTFLSPRTFYFLKKRNLQGGSVCG